MIMLHPKPKHFGAAIHRLFFAKKQFLLSLRTLGSSCTSQYIPFSWEIPLRLSRMEIHLLSARGIFCTTRGPFLSFPVTKPVVTQGAARYQIRCDHYPSTDTPYFLWVKWFVYYIPSKSSVLSKKYENGPTLLRSKIQLLGHFFIRL